MSVRTSDMQDAELAALAAAGDREAFGKLVERYAAQARRVARSILGNEDDADDAAQDAFLAALRHLGRYDATRPFGPWLMRIGANQASDRRRRRKVRAAEEVKPDFRSKDAGPDVQTDREAFGEQLRGALAELPERQRMAVVLFDVEGYSHREIAEVLDVPEGTVRSDVFHGRRQLRTKLEAWKGWREEVR